MTAPRRSLVAGNWKMNGLSTSLDEINELKTCFSPGTEPGCDIVICPPATLLSSMQYEIATLKIPIHIGAQDCHPNINGANTGDLSAEMMADAGASYVIVGHSERRANHSETDQIVCAKAEAAHRAGLVSIVCVGENLNDRDSGQAIDVVSNQLIGSLSKQSDGANTVVAYEPVWAIGTGRTPKPEEIESMHDAIRRRIATMVGVEAGYMRILYGGSVKPDNAAELLAIEGVDGALVGGASLKLLDFWHIISTYQ